MSRCKNRGERRELNNRKFWQRVMRQAWMWRDLLLPESWRQRNWVADQHNCSCGLCRRETRKILGNSERAIPIQEKKLRIPEIDVEFYNQDEAIKEILKDENYQK